MNRIQAERRYVALLRMTAKRGCTDAEAATAREIARRIAKMWDLDSCATESVAQDERQAARRWGWEYRHCGRKNCWCFGKPIREAHGPYRYEKRREGRRVRSIYQGREPL